jgi:hypothetical protein
MGLKHGIKLARRSLGYLSMQDELKDRMELAVGTLREMASTSNSPDTSKKNQRSAERFFRDYEALNKNSYDIRDLEILASKLVDLCTDVIEDNTQELSKK